MPEDYSKGSSIFAEEGSAAHFLAETVLRMWAHHSFDDQYPNPLQMDWRGLLIAKPADPTLEGQWNDEDDYEFYGQSVAGRGDVDPISHAHPTNQFVVDDVMQDAVFMYVETVKGFYEGAVDPSLQIETMVRPLANRDDVFGTADAIVTDTVGGEVWVVDFKYGRGVKVTAPHNTQAMFYAAGALQRAVENGHGWQYEDRVNVVIVQPRIQFNDGTSISEWKTTVGEITKWAINDLQLAVEDTRDKSRSKYEAGDYCRWCAAAPLCPLLQATALTTAQEAFAEDLVELPYSEAGTVELILPAADDDPALAEAMKIAAVLENWTKKVRELADFRQRSGGALPGFKMVRKRTNRRWIDAAATTKTLRAATDQEQMEEAFTSKLKSPTQMEKAGFDKDLVAGLTEKPEGGLTLVPDTDPRKESMTAISAFSSVDDE
jgi:hypothetical protein